MVSMGTVIVIIILALVLGFAVVYTVKGMQGKNNVFSCGGDCSHCSGGCGKKKERNDTLCS